MSEPKEFRVTMQLRNNRMLELRESKGWTQPEAAMACLVSQGAWSGLETLRDKPTVWGGGGWRSKDRVRVWSSVAMKIADAFDVTPEWLWPEEVQAVAGGKKSLRVGADEAMALMGAAPQSPELVTASHDLRLETRKVLSTLTPREEKVLRMRFGIGEKSDHTYEEIAKDFEVTRERIHQIEQGALRKLRRPSAAREFAPIVADEGRRLRDGEEPIANRLKGVQ